MSKVKKPQVIQFLKNAKVMSLAAVYEGKPISSIVLFGIDEALNFYFVTHTDTFKAKALLSNPLISLCVWEHKKMLVQTTGTAQKVEGTKEIESAMDLIMGSAAKVEDFWPPLLMWNTGEYIVFQIKVNWMKILDLTQKNLSGAGSAYTEIEL